MKNCFIIIGIVLLNIGCKKRYESIRLIPKGYEGPVAIVYGVSQSNEVIEEDGKVVYEIPKDGLLIVERNVEYGNQMHEHFYVDSLENREPIPYLFEWNKIDKSSEKVACFGEVIGKSLQHVKGKEREVAYTLFLVGRISQSDSLYKVRDKFLEKALK